MGSVCLVGGDDGVTVGAVLSTGVVVVELSDCALDSGLFADLLSGEDAVAVLFSDDPVWLVAAAAFSAFLHLALRF